jgi:hypothetical protein
MTYKFNEKYHDDILSYITENGPSGVNAIATGLNVPLSTMQHYLDKSQNYFKKNSMRKWVLPEMYDSVESATVTNNVTNVVESNLNSVKALLNSVIGQIDSTIMVLPTLKTVSATVADKSFNIDRSLIDLDKSVKETYAAIKKYLGVIPEEYKDLIKNIDLYTLIITLGNKYLQESLFPEIARLMTEQTDTLSSDAIDTLKMYQKGVNNEV